MVMLPALTAAGMLAPVESERTTWLTWIADEVLVVPGDRENVNWATAPSAMMLWFIPKITHVADPLATVQDKDLPAELAAAPSAAVTPVISAGAY